MSYTRICVTKVARARTKEEVEQTRAAKLVKELAKEASRARSRCRGTSGRSEMEKRKLLIRTFGPRLHAQDRLVARMTQTMTG